MIKVFASGLAGAVFGIGLTVSQMINPAKVLSFLDVSGTWDPSLALVMASALLVTGVGYAIVLKQRSPFLADTFSLPTSIQVDFKLVFGSALFGVGWGLTGLCPGPAISGVGFSAWELWPFLAGLFAGMLTDSALNRIKLLENHN